MQVVPNPMLLQNVLASTSAALPPQAKPEAPETMRTVPYSWYDKVPDQPALPYPVLPVKTEIKFGLVPHPPCGVCPFCVASGLAEKEVAAIAELRQGKDLADADDMEIEVGQSAASLRSQGSGEAGVKMERSSIGNEDGTRLQPLSSDDLDIYAVAALPRVYETPDARTYKIIADTRNQNGRGGIRNGLFKAVTGGQVEAARYNRDGSGETFSYECRPGDPPAPIQNFLGEFNNENQPLSMQVKTLGIYHHVSEGPKVRDRSFKSLPLLAGYTSVAKLKDDELFVLSVRELPKFETLGIEAGGLMNAMGMAAKAGLDSMMVLVEPWQKGLKDYIEKDLQEKYGYAVEIFTQGQMPDPYVSVVEKLDVPAGTQLVRIPLEKLQAAWQEIKTKDLHPGEKDTELMETIGMPDAIKEAEDTEPVSAEDRDKKRRENAPSASRITILSRRRVEIPDHELIKPDISDTPTDGES